MRRSGRSRIITAQTTRLWCISGTCARRSRRILRIRNASGRYGERGIALIREKESMSMTARFFLVFLMSAALGIGAFMLLWGFRVSVYNLLYDWGYYDAVRED